LPGGWRTFARMLDKRVKMRIIICRLSPNIIKTRMTPVEVTTINRFGHSMCSSSTHITQGDLFYHRVRARQLPRIERMDLPGYPVTAAVLKTAAKETYCSSSRALSNQDMHVTKLHTLSQHRHIYTERDSIISTSHCCPETRY
jgi:hypothetical protein